MDADELAERLLRGAIAHQQASHQLTDEDDEAAIRREVRVLARARGIKIRTGVVEDAVVVILADAELWGQSAAVMREKLQPSV